MSTTTAEIEEKEKSEESGSEPEKEQATTRVQNEEESQPKVFSGKTESKSVGFGGKMKKAFTTELRSTIMTVLFVTLWSERILTTFNIPFSIFKGRAPRDTSQTADSINLSSTIREKAKSFSTAEKLVAISTIGGLAQNIWFFFSNRASELPEADTFWGKVKEVIKHPNKHSIQMTNLAMGAALIPMAIGRILQGWVSKFKGRDAIEKMGNTVPLVGGFAMLVSIPMSAWGFLNIKAKNASNKQGQIKDPGKEMSDVHQAAQENAVKPFKKSNSITHQGQSIKDVLLDMARVYKPSNLKELAKFAWKEDRMGCFARMFALGLDICFTGVGVAKLQKIKEKGWQPENWKPEDGVYAGSVKQQQDIFSAKQNFIVGIVGFCTTAFLQNPLFYAKVRDSRNAKEQQEMLQLKQNSGSKSDYALAR